LAYLFNHFVDEATQKVFELSSKTYETALFTKLVTSLDECENLINSHVDLSYLFNHPFSHAFFTQIHKLLFLSSFIDKIASKLIDFELSESFLKLIKLSFFSSYKFNPPYSVHTHNLS
jgi:hypothetical protein